MPEDREKQEALLVKKPSDFSDRLSKGDKLQQEEDRKTKEKIQKALENVRPLSQQEQEHLTYLFVYEKYNEYKNKRSQYRFYGSLFILISAIVFLLLMFSLEGKIVFLGLWIVTVIFCVVMMIRVDYLYNMYKEMLGICDEFDLHDFDNIDMQQNVSAPPEASASTGQNAVSSVPSAQETLSSVPLSDHGTDDKKESIESGKE